MNKSARRVHGSQIGEERCREECPETAKDEKGRSDRASWRECSLQQRREHDGQRPAAGEAQRHERSVRTQLRGADEIARRIEVRRHNPGDGDSEEDEGRAEDRGHTGRADVRSGHCRAVSRMCARIRALTKRVRLDQLLVQRDLAPSRERAQALILAGVVRVDGGRVDRAATPVAEDAELAVDKGPQYVSRGGDKLAGALDALGLDVAGKVAIDVGSSTGGFTDVLLQRGAVRVHAVDVGKGQLDWGIRQDPRVVVHEGVNAREGVPVEEVVDIVVADVSFISLRLALPPALAKLRDGGDVVALVKPQFEAGRDAVGKGGVVREPEARAAAVVAVANDLASRGFGVVAVTPSPIEGREGNREIFVHARKGAQSLDETALAIAAREAAG